MKELFVPYELALLAKEKGFDDECLAHWRGEELIFSGHTQYTLDKYDLGIQAPLYQQLLDFFRIRYIHIIIRPGFGITTWYDWRIVSLEHEDIFATQNESYEKIENCYNKALKEAFKLI